jgi:hypothetical protein
MPRMYQLTNKKTCLLLKAFQDSCNPHHKQAISSRYAIELEDNPYNQNFRGRGKSSEETICRHAMAETPAVGGTIRLPFLRAYASN